jgi:hypothetical protein
MIVAEGGPFCKGKISGFCRYFGGIEVGRRREKAVTFAAP